MARRTRCYPWIVVLLVVLIAGCAPKIIPKLPQGGEIDSVSSIITKKGTGISVSIQTEAWSFEPYYLTDYFTPFLFLIRNDTDQKVPIRLPEFVLFDEQGNQFNAVPPEGVETMILARDLYGRGASTSFFFRYEDIHPSTGVGVGVEFPAYVRRPFSNISLLALTDGEIHPKSQVRGFIYFKKATTYGQHLKLKVNVSGFAEDFDFEVKK
jgi:hypothetical protein